MGKRIRMFLRNLEYKLEDGFDFLYNDTLINAGRFIIDLFVTSVSLFYAVTGLIPVIPRWAWFGIFVFMLVAGVSSLEDLIYTGYDEDGKKIMDEDEDEDEEIIDDD